jgi:hypothetical protein
VIRRKPTTFKTSVPAREPGEAGWLRAVGVKAQPKVQNRVRHDIRDSARDETCLVRLPGCTGSAIWSHNRHGRAGKGRGIKSICLNGCYCCPACDALYDSQRPAPLSLTRQEIELAWYHAHAESLVRLAQKGLV